MAILGCMDCNKKAEFKENVNANLVCQFCGGTHRKLLSEEK